MPVAPSGSLNLVMSSLKAMLAQSPTFIAMVQSNVPTASAADQIFKISSLPYLSAGSAYSLDVVMGTRPCATINISPHSGLTVSQSSVDTQIENGQIFVLIEDNVSKAGTYQDCADTFLNNVGAIVDELREASQADDAALHIDRITYGAITRTEPAKIESYGDAHACLLTIHSGLRA